MGNDVRCVWGLDGLQHAARDTDVFVIVDVLSFSTAVDIALERGAEVHPWRWTDESGPAYARRIGGVLAGPRNAPGYSLSPLSLLDIERGTKLVLPSPNGATLSRATGETPTITACLRNAQACARTAGTLGRRVTVVAAGELWPTRDALHAYRLRPALEDWLGAGAVVAALEGDRTPEAQAAADGFEAARATLLERLLACTSGRELVGRGFERDVTLAAESEASAVVPRLVGGAYVG